MKPIRIASQPAISRAQTLHVSPSGLDENIGSIECPLRSISEAARRAMPGDTILIHPGIYRERVDPPRGGTSESCRITYQAVEPGKAEIRGSEIVKGWEREKGDVWKVEVPNTFFGGFNPFATLLQGHWFVANGRMHHRGAVYLNGHWLTEASTADKPGSSHGGDPLWFAEVGESLTTVRAEFPGVDPNRECVEINVRPTVFYPSRAGCDFITVRGLVLQHAATPWSPPTTEQIGLLGTNWSKGWIIDGNVVRYSIAAGITLGKYHDPLDFPEKPIVEYTGSEDTYHGTIRRALEHGWSLDAVGNHTVRNNVVSHCEMAGICGSLGAVRSLIEGNTIHDIHVRQLFIGAEQAGIKFHAPIDSQITGNRIFRCYRGLWLDWMTQGTRVSGNLFHDNGPEHDLFIEVNHGPFLVDNNLLLSPASLSSWSEGGAYVHNFFAGRVDAQSELGRVTPFHHAHSTAVAGWKNISLGNDVFLNNVFAHPLGLSAYDSATEPVRMEGNAYLGGAAPSIHDRLPLRIEDFPVASIFVEAVAGQVFFHSDSPWQSESSACVDSDRLGKSAITGLPFEKPDGSPAVVDQDYFGKPRALAQAGPFVSLTKKDFPANVWPRSH